MSLRSSLDLTVLRIKQSPLHPPTVLMTFAIGAAGGFLAMAVNAPLPMLFGSVIAIALVAMLRVRLFGHAPAAPLQLRLAFIPIIGLSIGGAFTPEVLAEATEWWPSLIALAVYVPMIHLAGYVIYRRLGGLSHSTSYYAAVPGGLIEAITLGEEAGADPRMMTSLQFMRLILCIMLVPLGFTLVFGAVGSSAGAALEQGAAPLGPRDIVILTLTGIGGLWFGRRFNLPAGVITGPVLFSAAVHFIGLTRAVPPIWLIQATQLVMGVTLGIRFVGQSWPDFLKATKLAFANIVLNLVLAFLAALAISGFVAEPPEAVILAFAPGGLAEMALIAVSLQISVVYVTAHHVARLLVSVTFAKLFATWIPKDEKAWGDTKA